MRAAFAGPWEEPKRRLQLQSLISHSARLLCTAGRRKCSSGQSWDHHPCVWVWVCLILHFLNPTNPAPVCVWGGMVSDPACAELS